ncbi:hypothetical protein SR1949_25760 [Sphaerospermopsis reniformis]|uniref:DUF3040 domain-containing protein n=1 Tax=Sphaerospermopsis reniformis TaxID=531300 RepID=A0A479ZXT2_9CYAN|nr:hypothetical protein [Sphaerospermopsis reniformis]GCL37465.1 hypothetical protein SR1949_25760 [Sphaerospermopsis reniformis]
MTSQDEHNRKLQRRVDKRLQEIDNLINSHEAPFYPTQKYQPENSQKPAKKTVIFAAKLLGLGVAAVVVVQISLFLARIAVIAALAFFVYKLFLESKLPKMK